MSTLVRTERLELRPVPPEAAAALADDRAVAASLIGAELDPGWPRRDLLDVLPRQSARNHDQARFGVWMIILRETQTVIGDAGFHGPPSDETIEIGYSVVRAHRRHGYATEAAEALIGWVLAEEDVRTIIARCDEDNEASIRTLERLGFTRTRGSGGELHWRRQGAPA